MEEKEMWVELGKKLNDKGIYFSDLLGHISVLNADESSFDNDEEMQEEVTNSLQFLTDFEEILNNILAK